MFKGQETDFVYFSELLCSNDKFSGVYKKITKILDKHNIRHGLLKNTGNIWCRDFMPIQLDKGKFVQFRYEPSYLRDYMELHTNPQDVCAANNINPVFSQINLDGGNIVNWSDKAIISSRIFKENPEYSDKRKLVSHIEKLLEVEVIVIPDIKSDYTGHADGMVRFVKSKTILGNDRNKEFAYWKKQMKVVLDKFGFEYIDIPFFEYKDKKYPDSAIGCYVNYLEVGNVIILPIFKVDGNNDVVVYRLFKDIFPDRIIEAVNINDIGVYGGLLNCITWTIKSEK